MFGRDAPPAVPLRLSLAPGLLLELFQDPIGAGPGGALWDAGVVLAQYVHSLGASLKGARVVELGAGTGAPGLVAALHGAAVTLTDRPRALPLLRRNAAANSLAVDVRELEWGAAAELQTPFDLVLAADCVCHAETMEAFLQELQRCTGSRGEALLTNKCRDVAEHAFWERLALLFHVQLLQEGVPESPRDGDELPVQLFRVWARTPGE